MAEERLKDAKALIDAGRWEFGYYAAGYVVECALKSCILTRMILTGWVFEEKSKTEACRVHEFAKLNDIAGLTEQLNADLQASSAAGKEFALNWGVVTG